MRMDIHSSTDGRNLLFRALALDAGIVDANRLFVDAVFEHLLQMSVALQRGGGLRARKKASTENRSRRNFHAGRKKKSVA